MNTNELGANYGNAVQAGYVGHVSIGAAPHPLPVPRQLPFVSPHFTGRAEQLAVLNDGTSELSVVVGTAGVGKTALVVRWARQAQDRFPHGTLYVNLRGYDPGTPTKPGDVLADFLAALGISPDRIPPHLDARAALYRSALAGRQLLIVLDNACDVAQVRPLLPGGTGCTVVVTSRADLKGLEIADGARRVPLGLLSEPEAMQLVRTVLGPRADAEPDGAVALVRACAGLPLALRIAAGRVATHPHLTIAELVGQLESDRWQVLSVPADELGEVRTVFDWSYRRLPDDQALMFRRLGLHPPHSISAPSAAAVYGSGLDDARRLLVCLADQHLVEPSGRHRFTCHDLLWAYAADLAEQDENSDEARRRLVEWAAHHARSAFRVLQPGMLVTHAGADIATRADPEIVFADAREAWAWAEAESVNAPALVRVAARCGPPEITMMLASVVTEHLQLTGRFNEAFEMCGLGLAAAREAGDRTGECKLLEDLGQLHQFVGRWDEATGLLRAALALARQLENAAVEAEVLGRLGWGCVELSEYREAEVYLEAAQVLLAGEPPGRFHSFIEACLCGVHTGLGAHELALRHGEKAVALLKNAGVEGALPYVFHALASAKQAVGAHAEAIELCEYALEVAFEHAVPRDRALLLEKLGESQRHTGEAEKAIACWGEALVIFEGLGDSRAPDLKKRLAALVSASAG